MKSEIAPAVGTAGATAGNAIGQMGAKLQTVLKPLNALDRALARAVRADHHIADLKARLAERQRLQESAIEIGANPKIPDKVLVNPRPNLTLDLMFGVLIGEICYNLRAALDYLVFELAKLDANKVMNGTQFPICDTQKQFSDRQGLWLNGLSNRHVAEIETLQPYNGCGWTGALRDISNPDKHRTLTVVEAEHGVDIEVREQLSDLQGLPGSIRTVLLGNGITVHVRLHLTTKLQFGDGSPVVGPLEEIKVNVIELLEKYKPEFN